VSVRHVLDHNSGLPAWVRVHSFEDLKQIKLVLKPGEKRVYSDIGFMALGRLLEKRFGQKLDALFPPLQRGGQGGFYPWPHFHGPVPVDDENCRDLGGVAGHAGLFGTLDAVKNQAQYLLEHLDRQALGFDEPTAGGSTGEALSSRAVGHLGFTGTSLWLDPETHSIYILLTRVLGRDSETRARLLKLRRAFHQQAN
jgi:CubicO group peptidase (beta-lactamase class C family)